MAETIQPAAAAKPRRNTGDWRGLPGFLNFLAVIACVVALISVFGAIADGSSFHTSGASVGDWLIAGSLFGSAIFLHCAAAIIAALRGILNPRETTAARH